MSETNAPIGRPVRVMSLSFNAGKSLDDVAAIIDREAVLPTDLIALPETWHITETSPPQPLDGPIITRMRQLARKHNTYIVCGLDRADGAHRWNSAVLIDRRGEIAGVYDKVYVFWGEFDKKPIVENGTVVPVFQCDFGRVGMAICFDANFSNVWDLLAEQGAELVIWPSAYSAGTTLQAHAIRHHYYIVTSTWACDCLAYDITGRQILYTKQPGLNVTRVTLDLDRSIHHLDFNCDKFKKLMAEHGEDLEYEPVMHLEGWNLFRAKRPGVSARALTKQYGIEDLRDYIPRSRREIDVMRGHGIRGGNQTA